MMIIEEVCGLAEVSWLDSHHLHPELCQLQPDDLSEALQRVLGGRVDTEAGVRVTGRHARDVYQPPLGLLEQGQGELGDVEAAPEVGVHLVPDLVQGLPVELSTHTQPCTVRSAEVLMSQILKF